MLKKISLALIGFYQGYVRIWLPSCCRFNPSCSEYTCQAIRKYGALRGLLKGMVRILHCHPYSGKSWYDPLI
ncbi:MAG: membrane protein insertion efficiency factor YidD [Candidatus Omnitrophota bacterium]|jgi:hypothetical protein